MVAAKIIYNQGQVLTTGYGMTKELAEKNASIVGIIKLEQMYGLKFEDVRQF
jgi:hypothetical protein